MLNSTQLDAKNEAMAYFRRPTNHKSTIVSILFLLVSLTSYAATIYVPGDRPSIQAGLDAARQGDTVIVADGVYRGNLSFGGKVITVKSANGANNCIIDCEESGRGFRNTPSSIERQRLDRHISMSSKR